MRTLSTRALLLALALAGCTESAPDPLAPSAPAVAAVSGAAAAARRATELPFRGTLEARETGQFQPATSTVLVHLVGTGTANHLGRYTLVADFTLTPATSTAVGQITLTAANGDVLTASFTGRSVPTAAGVVAIAETATLTGGTGRFAGATGSFVLTRSLTRATGLSFGSFEGRIGLGR